MTVVHELVGIHCACCELPAIRETIDDDGPSLFLCDRCPSPDEIGAALAYAKVGTNWTIGAGGTASRGVWG